MNCEDCGKEKPDVKTHVLDTEFIHMEVSLCEECMEARISDAEMGDNTDQAIDLWEKQQGEAFDEDVLWVE